MALPGPIALDAEETRRLLSVRVVGRLAFTDAQGLLQVLPVNYRSVGDDVYWLTQAQGLLSQATTADQVVFEVDYHDDLEQNGWSILVRGEVEVVEDDDVRAQLTEIGLRPWASGDRTTLVRLVARETSGRRVRLGVT